MASPIKSRIPTPAGTRAAQAKRVAVHEPVQVRVPGPADFPALAELLDQLG